MPKIKGEVLPEVTRLFVTNDLNGEIIKIYFVYTNSVTQEKLAELEKIKNDNFVIANVDNFINRNFKQLKYNNIFIDLKVGDN